MPYHDGPFTVTPGAPLEQSWRIPLTIEDEKLIRREDAMDSIRSVRDEVAKRYAAKEIDADAAFCAFSALTAAADLVADLICARASNELDYLEGRS